MIPIVRSLGIVPARNGFLQSTGVKSAAVRFKTDFYKHPQTQRITALPEKRRLPILNKVPQFPTMRAPKMQKMLRLMRGPEEVHNTLILGQYGIQALSGGRLRYGHLEMIRRTVAYGMDQSKMYAIWRVEDPWQSVTKLGQGKRLGGGKGYIDHYVTPIKHGRIIVEIAGNCLMEEVEPFLRVIVNNLPFKAMIVDNNILMAKKKLEELAEEENINPYTMKYLIQNRMCRSYAWTKPMDRKHFGKYV